MKYVESYNAEQDYPFERRYAVRRRGEPPTVIIYRYKTDQARVDHLKAEREALNNRQPTGAVIRCPLAPQ